METGYLPRI